MKTASDVAQRASECQEQVPKPLREGHMKEGDTAWEKILLKGKTLVKKDPLLETSLRKGSGVREEV